MIGESKYFHATDRTAIYCSVKEIGAPVWIICTHGIGEHGGRHRYLSDLFGQYFNILHYDLRGHGRSEGRRGSVDSFDLFRQDLFDVIRFLQNDYRMKRYVLFGHSMGALITAMTMQNFDATLPSPERVFLSAPPVGLGGGLGKLVNKMSLEVFQKLAKMPWSIKLGGLVDLSKLSHEAHVEVNYREDPLNCLKLDTKLLFEMVCASKRTFQAPLSINCPLYVAAGGADVIVSPEKLEEYFALFEPNARVKIIEKGYHELHNEVEKYRNSYFSFLKDSIMESFLEGHP